MIRHFRRKNSESEDFALDALQNEIHKEKVKKKGGGDGKSVSSETTLNDFIYV